MKKLEWIEGREYKNRFGECVRLNKITDVPFFPLYFITKYGSSYTTTPDGKLIYEQNTGYDIVDYWEELSAVVVESAKEVKRSDDYHQGFKAGMNYIFAMLGGSNH